MTHAGSRRFAGPGFARLGFARLGLAAAVLAALAAGWPAAAQQRPMLMEGTETVYQRVLTRPGAPMSVTPDGPATKQYPAFQPLYVFAREDGWIEVGPSSAAAPEGWVPADRVVDWRQNIVAAFTNPAGRQRQALFGTEQALRALMEDEAVRETEARLIADQQHLKDIIDARTAIILAVIAPHIPVRAPVFAALLAFIPHILSFVLPLAAHVLAFVAALFTLAQAFFTLGLRLIAQVSHIRLSVGA